MKPHYLYHGSRTAIREKFLRPRKANNQCAVYATEIKDVALGMSLTGDPYTSSMGKYKERPFQIKFLRGKPQEKTRYVYKVSSKTFKEQPKGSHQWISFEPVKILKVEKFHTKALEQYWRKATKKEKEQFYQR